MINFRSVNLVKIGYVPVFVHLKSIIFLPYCVTSFEVLKRISISLFPIVDPVICCLDPLLRMEALIDAFFHLPNCGLP